MSEFLQNDAEKQELIKGIIKRLHDGEPVERVRRDFARLIANVSPTEIASMEQQLIQEGMPVAEVQRLCDVHVDVFKNAMSKEGGTVSKISGHPVDTYRMENREAKRRVKALVKLAKSLVRSEFGEATVLSFARELDEFADIEKHYARKENQLFPYLERVGFTGPSTVMWGKHDEIRAVLKSVRTAFADRNGQAVLSAVKDLSTRVRKMIFMEERILFPNAMKRLGDDEWVAIRRGEPEIGYAWVTPGDVWDANMVAGNAAPRSTAGEKPAQPRSVTGSAIGVPFLAVPR